MKVLKKYFLGLFLALASLTNLTISSTVRAAKPLLTKRATVNPSPSKSAKPLQPVQKVPANFSAATMQSSEGQLTGGQKPLEIRGQSRKLEMLQTLKSQSDELDYVKPRKNYKPELGKTLD